MRYLWCLIFLAGCLRVGPDFGSPETPLQREWLESGDAQISTAPDRLPCWWHVFDDPVLDELVEIAIDQNLDLQGACFRIAAARAELGIAIGEWFPQTQQLEGVAERVKLSKNAPNVLRADHNYWDFEGGLRVAWELDFWGRFRRGIEAADENLLAIVANYDDVLVLLQGDVAATYVTIRTLQERIEILLHNVAIQERSLEIVNARWEAGMVTELDVQQARTLVYGTQSRLPPLQAELRSAYNALAVLLGMTPDMIECFVRGPEKIPAAPREVAVGIPADLLCRRPDIRRALHRTAAQSARIGIAVSDLLPRISLLGFIGFESSADIKNAGSPFFSADSLTYFFGPGFAWPILNYGRLTNRVRFERARFYEELVAYQNTVLRAYREVEDSLIAFLKAQEEVEQLVQSVKAAERATSLSRTQYVEGIADYTRVLNTEQALLDEQERLVLARGDIALGLVATYRALGGGWECECR